MTTKTKVTYTPDADMGYFPTPPEVADDLVYWVIEPGHGDGAAGHGVPQVRVLEPSAGEGHLARVVREYLPYAHITAVEPNPERAKALHSGGVVDEVHDTTIEDYLATFDGPPFDLVFMNPPFVLGRNRAAWADHVLAIYHHPRVLAPGGLLGAIVPRVALTGKSAPARRVRELTGWTDNDLSRRGDIEAAAKGSFDPSLRIGIALMWAQKPALKES